MHEWPSQKQPSLLPVGSCHPSHSYRDMSWISQQFKSHSAQRTAASIESTQEPDQRSTIELYFVIHQNNKLSISASYCNKLNNQKLTKKKKKNRYTSIYTMFLMYTQSPAPCYSGSKRQIRHEAASTWCHQQQTTNGLQSEGKLDRTRLIQCQVPSCALKIRSLWSHSVLCFDDNTDLIWAYLNIKRHWLMLLSALGK